MNFYFVPMSKALSSHLIWGGETRLIQSAVKYWKFGKFFLIFNYTISWEEHKTIFSGLRISEMTLPNQITEDDMPGPG
jgi:hypothetical protein